MRRYHGVEKSFFLAFLHGLAALLRLGLFLYLCLGMLQESRSGMIGLNASSESLTSPATHVTTPMAGLTSTDLVATGLQNVDITGQVLLGTAKPGTALDLALHIRLWSHLPQSVAVYTIWGKSNLKNAGHRNIGGSQRHQCNSAAVSRPR